MNASVFLLIFFFIFSGPALAAPKVNPLPDPTKTTVIWNKNPEPDVIKYIVSWGTKTKVYTKSKTTTNNYYDFVDLVIGGKTYYFIVEAVNTGGLISKRSVELKNTFPIKPTTTAPRTTDKKRVTSSREGVIYPAKKR